MAVTGAHPTQVAFWEESLDIVVIFSIFFNRSDCSWCALRLGTFHFFFSSPLLFFGIDDIFDALLQGGDTQLGMAIDSTKATLAVKRRLACEMVKYWQQV